MLMNKTFLFSETFDPLNMPGSPVWRYQMKCPTSQNNARPIRDALICSQPTRRQEKCKSAHTGNLQSLDLTL